MLKNALVGSRIRKRRLDQGMKQADLARCCGISAAYLNLIEHNRRRIGGKLLINIAQALGTDASSLSKGVAAALLEGLHEAAEGRPEQEAAPEDIRDFASRFPGWAGLVAAQQTRIAALEHNLETLSDRLTHDPFLSETLHAVLSSATAIRSAAAILVETRDIDPAWQTRFQRNLNEDAEKLAEQAQGLMRYLDGAADAGKELSLPQEELEAFFAENGWHFKTLEAVSKADETTIIRRLVNGSRHLQSRVAKELAESWLHGMAADARALPERDFAGALDEIGCNPAALARYFDCDAARVMRRIAGFPTDLYGAGAKAAFGAKTAETTPRPDRGGAPFGLLVCDASGAFVFRKPVTGFSLPRFGAACPLWPVFAAFRAPAIVSRHMLETPGPATTQFVAFATAQPQAQVDYTTFPTLEATMLVAPRDVAQALCANAVSDPEFSSAPVLRVGNTCRVCPRRNCTARREPTILAVGSEPEQSVVR